MIAGKRVLGIIPARGGSKGVPRKNLRTVGGKPLIAWTILAAQQSKYLDRLILSSEDEEIIRVAKEWGCDVPFVRPAELAQDDTSGVAPVLDAVQRLPDYDCIVLLQPTSPMRSVEDIDGCLELLVSTGSRSVVSVAAVEKSPYWMYLLDHGRLRPLLETAEHYSRRQDLPAVFALNGAVYVAECDWLVANGRLVGDETVAYPMPKERSLDIDTELDMLVADCLLSGKAQI